MSMLHLTASSYYTYAYIRVVLFSIYATTHCFMLGWLSMLVFMDLLVASKFHANALSYSPLQSLKSRVMLEFLPLTGMVQFWCSIMLKFDMHWHV